MGCGALIATAFLKLDLLINSGVATVTRSRFSSSLSQENNVKTIKRLKIIEVDFMISC